MKERIIEILNSYKYRIEDYHNIKVICEDDFDGVADDLLKLMLK